MEVKDFLIATNILTQKYYEVNLYSQKILDTESFEGVNGFPLATDVDKEVLFAVNVSPLCLHYGACSECILSKYNDECPDEGSTFNIFAGLYSEDTKRGIDIDFKNLILSYNISLIPSN